jgi:hypothetical protein
MEPGVETEILSSLVVDHFRRDTGQQGIILFEAHVLRFV